MIIARIAAPIAEAGPTNSFELWMLFPFVFIVAFVALSPRRPTVGSVAADAALVTVFYLFCSYLII